MQTFYSHIEKNRRAGFLFKLLFCLGFFCIGTVVGLILVPLVNFIYIDSYDTEPPTSIDIFTICCAYAAVSIIILVSYINEKQKIKKGVVSLFEGMGHLELQKVYNNLLLERSKMTFKLSDGQFDIFRLITPESCKVLSDIIEEISIAANVKRPYIFIDLTNKNINACTLGLDKNKAGISVSFGALTQLSRDEMQGVIAHEFSHLCNGDTEINMRAIAAIRGMTVISDIGSVILSLGERSSGLSSKKSNKPGFPPHLYMVGLGLVFCGMIGSIFGEIMKLAISRKNEYLADATAVKYTRNPRGLIGAFLKISTEESFLQFGSSPYSHMYFTSAFKEIFNSHPSLENRIKALELIAGKGEVNAVAEEVKHELEKKRTISQPSNSSHNVNTKLNQDQCELNRAIVAATAISQIYNDSMIVNGSDYENILNSDFTTLAQAVSAIIRLSTLENESLEKLASTAPSSFKRELIRGPFSIQDKNVFFNAINKCRALYKLSPQIIQEQARAVISNYKLIDPNNMSALAIDILFTTETVNDTKKFNEKVFEAMVPRLFGFLLSETVCVSSTDFTTIYTKCLEKCGVKYAEYHPFAYDKLSMVLSSFCELDTYHFRMVTEAIDSMFADDSPIITKDFIVIRALLEAHCENHEKTKYSVDESEVELSQNKIQSLAQIMAQAGLSQDQDSQKIKLIRNLYDSFLRITSLLVEKPASLLAINNLFDVAKLKTVINTLKDTEKSKNYLLSEQETFKLMAMFRQDFLNADVTCKRGLNISFNRLFNEEPYNTKLAYFSLIINLVNVLDSNYTIPIEKFGIICSSIYSYLATNSTPLENKTQQDYLNHACSLANISAPILQVHTIRDIFGNLLKLHTASYEQKKQFKLGFDYIIEADNDITENERFLNFIISTVIIS